MSGRAIAQRALRAFRRAEARLARPSARRRILVDARTRVNYVMVAPVYRAMRGDPRVEFFFTASEEPARLREIYAEAAEGTRLITPRRAAVMKFHAYVASDFMWAPLPRGTRRVQVFHGVAGKYGFDAPTTSMRVWHRLFFINRRRLRNFIRAGAIDQDSPAIRLVGMPKVDCLVDGTLRRDAVLQEIDLDPSRPTVLYAPTWSAASSLNAFGEALVARLAAMPLNLIVKLHDRSRDLRGRYSGGRDWAAALAPLVQRRAARLVGGSDICPYLAAADAMITDHSSAGFEYLLLDRPIVRIHRPALIEAANIHPDYVRLLADVSDSAGTLDETLAAVERALAAPGTRSATRRAVAAELFHEPGTATERSVQALYETIGLERPVPALQPSEALCEPSA